MALGAHLELAFASRNARAIAGINDAPILRNLDGESIRTRMPLALWLMPRDNWLTFSVEPLPGGAGAQGKGGAPGEGPLVDVAVVAADNIVPPQARVMWGLPRGTAFDPIRIRLPFVPKEVPPTRLWQEAAQLGELTVDKRQRARALGMEVFRAFRDRDVEQVLALSSYRLEETARAFGDDEEELRIQARKEYEEWFAEPGYGLWPVLDQFIQVTPCCGGRVFLLTGEDERDLISAVPRGTAKPATMEVFVAQIGSRWRVVR